LWVAQLAVGWVVWKECTLVALLVERLVYSKVDLLAAS
jgi:hypothetical protein